MQRSDDPGSQNAKFDVSFDAIVDGSLDAGYGDITHYVIGYGTIIDNAYSGINGVTIPQSTGTITHRFVIPDNVKYCYVIYAYNQYGESVGTVHMPVPGFGVASGTQTLSAENACSCIN